MKILLDPQIFNDQKFGGISKYYSEIYKKLTKKSIDITLPLLYTENLHIKEFFVARQNSWYHFFIRNNIFRRKFIRKIKRQNLKYAKKEIAHTDFDLFIPTYYNPYFLDIIGNKPYVLTVYDMIHELFPHYFSASDKTSENKKLLLHNAAQIIAVSNNTKKDILKIYPEIPSEKITVVYHGFSHETANDVQVSLPKRFVLFVGNRENYKNFNFFVESIQETLKNDKDLFLVCAGGNAFRSDEKALLRKLDLEDKVIQRNFLDSEINSYYRQALCFVFPSIYEGFGIPIMESMINNCAIILTDNSCFPEVAGDAALYYKLHDKADLKEKVEALVYDQALRQQYAALGSQRVKAFTWEKAADECLAVYQKATREKS